jgi:hypothetical protein
MNLDNPLNFTLKGQKENPILQQHKRMALDFYHVFNSPSGERVLAFLKSRTLDQPCWNPSYGENAERTAYAREGQNNIVREIIKMIQFGKETPNE